MSMVSHSLSERDYHRALGYAMIQHAGQVRKGSSEPYIMHPFRASQAADDNDEPWAVVIALALHDTIEDTTSTKTEILHLFGREVGLIVDGLTDKFTREACPDMSREERKINENKRFESVGIWTKVAKMYDIQDNLNSDTSNVDKTWRLRWLKEKIDTLDAIKNVNMPFARNLIAQARLEIEEIEKELESL